MTVRDQCLAPERVEAAAYGGRAVDPGWTPGAFGLADILVPR